jgi:hypothetical protein
VPDATYSGNPASSAKDAMRFTLGDTDRRDWLLSDAEIEAAIAAAWPHEGDPPGSALRRAAAVLASGLAMRFSREASFRSGPLTMQLRERAQDYREIAKQFRARAAMAVPTTQLPSEEAPSMLPDQIEPRLLPDAFSYYDGAAVWTDR